jgi:hypothetical protein
MIKPSLPSLPTFPTYLTYHNYLTYLTHLPYLPNLFITPGTALALPWHVHFASAEDENKDDATVAQQCKQENNPYTWKRYAALKN